MSSVEGRFFADMGALAGLKARAGGESPQALREVAQQFESVFTRMLLKNMRAASFGDSLMGSHQGEFYRDMFDQQMAVTLSAGRGLGIADLLISQLGGGPAPAPVSPSSTVALTALAAARRRSDALVSTAPAEEAAKTTTEEFSPESPADFVRQVLPHAREAARRLGVAPQLVLAQAALESGWGAHPIRGSDGGNSNNLFGIKTGRRWNGPAALVRTLEYVSGMPSVQKAAFRVYESVADSFRDYADLLLGSERYKGALGQGDDAGAFGRALQEGGYATDPEYAAKLRRIVDSPVLRDALDAIKNDPAGSID